MMKVQKISSVKVTMIKPKDKSVPMGADTLFQVQGCPYIQYTTLNELTGSNAQMNEFLQSRPKESAIWNSYIENNNVMIAEIKKQIP